MGWQGRGGAARTLDPRPPMDAVAGRSSACAPSEKAGMPCPGPGAAGLDQGRRCRHPSGAYPSCWRARASPGTRPLPLVSPRWSRSAPRRRPCGCPGGRVRASRDHLPAPTSCPTGCGRRGATGSSPVRRPRLGRGLPPGAPSGRESPRSTADNPDPSLRDGLPGALAVPVRRHRALEKPLPILLDQEIDRGTDRVGRGRRGRRPAETPGPEI